MDDQGPEGFEELLAFLPGGDRLRGEFHEPVVDGVTGEITEFRNFFCIKFLEGFPVQSFPLGGHRSTFQLQAGRRGRSVT